MSKDPARMYKIHKRQEIVETAVKETVPVLLEMVGEEKERVPLVMVGEEKEKVGKVAAVLVAEQTEAMMEEVEEVMVDTEEELMAGMHLRLRNLYRSYPSHIKTFYHHLHCLYNLQKQHTVIH